MRRVVVLTVILPALAALSACGKQSPTASDTTPTTTAPTTSATAIVPRSAHDGCKAVPAPRPKADPNARLSHKKLDRKARYIAIVKTNCGTIRIQLANLRSPKTTSSFAGLVRRRYYDGLTFHRIAKPGGNDYVIQGGDPMLDGNGGPGYSVVEKPAKRTRYVRGVVAMAKASGDPSGASGSQFFVVTAREAPLPPDYAVLGRVVAGKKTVRRISRLATDPSTEMPLDPVVITSIRIERRR